MLRSEAILLTTIILMPQHNAVYSFTSISRVSVVLAEEKVMFLRLSCRWSQVKRPTKKKFSSSCSIVTSVVNQFSTFCSYCTRSMFITVSVPARQPRWVRNKLMKVELVMYTSTICHPARECKRLFRRVTEDVASMKQFFVWLWWLCGCKGPWITKQRYMKWQHFV